MAAGAYPLAFTNSSQHIDSEAILHKATRSALKLLVLGAPHVGKTTLISSCINETVNSELAEKPAYTITFNNTTRSSVTEVKGLHIYNKQRGSVWRSVVDFVLNNPIDVVWFCVGTDFLEDNDETWNWISRLTEVTHVILVRTKCLSPNDNIEKDSQKHFPPNHHAAPLRVFSLLAKDMQLNPKGGGAVVEGFGVEELVKATEKLISKRRPPPSSSVINTLFRQVASDGERYAAEEAQKGAMVSALRSMSNANDAIDDDEFVLVQTNETNTDGSFAHNMWQNKRTRTIMGALVALAVVVLILL